MNGFFAAFTQPMIIKGSGSIYTQYTSESVFNGQVEIVLSTDGKALIRGKLNFLENNISVSGSLYLDLSAIQNGRAEAFLLIDAPDQLQIFTIYGSLSVGFENLEGETFDIPIINTAQSTLQLATAPSIVNIDAASFNDVGNLNLQTFEGAYYIDIVYTAGHDMALDYASILDASDEFTATINTADGARIDLVLASDPIPIETLITDDGVVQENPVTGRVKSH